MARVGIIGTGWGARVQVPAFREAGLEVVAIAGHNAERTRKIAGELDVEPFDDWRELIASNIDLVTIVTPPSEHLQMATSALDAGKHVLCEKPTALECVRGGATRRGGTQASRSNRAHRSRAALPPLVPRRARTDRRARRDSLRRGSLRQSGPRRSDARVELVERCGSGRRHLGRRRLALRRHAPLPRHGDRSGAGDAADDHR